MSEDIVYTYKVRTWNERTVEITGELADLEAIVRQMQSHSLLLKACLAAADYANGCGSYNDFVDYVLEAAKILQDGGRWFDPEELESLQRAL
jgi:hypothetical protein